MAEQPTSTHSKNPFFIAKLTGVFAMDPNQLQHDEWNERLVGGDLLVGADAIRAFLVYLGMPEGTDPYYLKRAGHWPIGNTGGEGGKLIASKRRLAHHAEKITRGPTAA